MNKMEKAALAHAREEIIYRRSGQYKLDQIADKMRREFADKNAGHSPKCTLTKCHDECQKRS